MGIELSVVVSTLNDREHLLPCLDAIDEEVPSSSEVIVVNGPSTDGTTGAVRERNDVDVLVEISERNRNVSRNAGIEVAAGDVIALVGDEYTVEPGWYEAVESTMTGGADVVTGPTRGDSANDQDLKTPRTIGRRTVTPFTGHNVAFSRTVLEALDGFDENLATDGACDCSHRVAGLGFDVTWSAEMAVRNEIGTDGGRPDPDWGCEYHSLAYRLTKNYGPRPTILARIGYCAARDGIAGVRAILTGEATPTSWLGNGTSVLKSTFEGFGAGVRSRYRDRSSRRNPNGISARHDRAVRVYDRRK